MSSSAYIKGEIKSVFSSNRNTSNFLELIELYQELVGVICNLSLLDPNSKFDNHSQKHNLKKKLVERRTALLGLIEDERDLLFGNQEVA